MPAQTVEARPRAMHRYQLDSGVCQLTPAERVVRGKAARAEVPRDSHAVFDPPSDRADPIVLLEEQARWQRIKAGLDGRARDFYVRQLRDWKYSVDIETMLPEGLQMYGALCGWTLARAHARSGDRIAIAAYLGNSDVFDRAVTKFAAAYADQNERDYQSLVDAVASGRITADRGL
jgi:uncharacterized protein DUF2252